MDPKERLNDFQDALRSAMTGMQAGLWTGFPAIVDEFDADARTVSARCAIRMRVRSRNDDPPVAGAVKDKGQFWWADVPLMVDVPVIFPGGGGFSLTFPLFPGDEVYVSFASRCIDQWWKDGGVQNQAELRSHSLSDGFAIPGPRSQPHVEPDISVDTCQLRSDDGELYIELTRDQIINVVAPGGMNIKGPLTVEGDTTFKGKIDQDGGDVSVTGNTTFGGTVQNQGVPIDSTHKHTSTTPGSPTSTPLPA